LSDYKNLFDFYENLKGYLSKIPMSQLPSTISKLMALTANLIFGGIPSLIFFVWIERNCDLLWSKFGIDFPLINFENQHLWIRLF